MLHNMYHSFRIFKRKLHIVGLIGKKLVEIFADFNGTELDGQVAILRKQDRLALYVILLGLVVGSSTFLKKCHVQEMITAFLSRNSCPCTRTQKRDTETSF